MTPVQLPVTAFNADPSNVCSCDQEPGLSKPSKEQRTHLGKHGRRSMVGQGQRELLSAGPVGAGPVRSLPAAGPLWLWFIDL